MSLHPGGGSGGRCRTGSMSFGRVSSSMLRRWPENVREKLIYLLDLWKGPPSRCYNHDQTSVCLLPLGTRGWKDKQEQAMAATSGKLQCTVGLAIMEVGLPWYSHIILKGTTPRSLLSAWSDNMLCDCTETHWQTIESMLEFVTLLDNKLKGQSSAPDLYATSIPAARHGNEKESDATSTTEEDAETQKRPKRLERPARG